MSAPSELPPSSGQSRIGAFFGNFQDKVSDLKEAVGKSYAMTATTRALGNTTARMKSLARRTGLTMTELPASMRQSVTVKLRTAKSAITGKVPDIKTKTVTLTTTDEIETQKIYSLGSKTLNILLDQPQQTKTEKVEAKANEAAKKAISKATDRATSALKKAAQTQNSDKKAVRLLAAHAGLDKKSLAREFADQSGDNGVLLGDPKSVYDDLLTKTTKYETSVGEMPQQVVKDINRLTKINGTSQAKPADGMPLEARTEKLASNMLEMIRDPKTGTLPTNANEAVRYALTTLTQSTTTTSMESLVRLALPNFQVTQDPNSPRPARVWVENGEIHTEWEVSYLLRDATDPERTLSEGIRVTMHSSIPIDNPSAARHFPDTFTVYNRTETRT